MVLLLRDLGLVSLKTNMSTKTLKIGTNQHDFKQAKGLMRSMQTHFKAPAGTSKHGSIELDNAGTHD